MMRYAIIEDGVVINVVLADAPLADNWAQADDKAHVGGTWNGVHFSSPLPTDVLPPQKVTRRQARQALLMWSTPDGKNLLDAVPVAIAAIPDPMTRRLAQIEWDDSQEFERDRPLVKTLGAALGLSGVQIDELFIKASQL